MPRLAAIACLVLVALGAACSSGGGGSKTTGSGAQGKDAQEVVVWHGYTQAGLKEFNKLVAAFNRTHPTIHVASRFDGGNDSALQKVLASLAGGKAPDIAYLYGSDLPNISKSPQVASLDDLVNQKSFNWNDFWPGERRAATVKGHVKGIPALVDNLALVYNKRLFDAAHVAYPTKDWTWSDLRTAARKLTNKGKGIYGYAIP